MDDSTKSSNQSNTSYCNTNVFSIPTSNNSNESKCDEDRIRSNGEESAIPNKSKWSVVEIVNEHNHPMVKDVRVFHEHRQLTRDVRHIAVKMLKAGAKPSMVYEAIRNDDGAPTATRKDISNLNTRIHYLEEKTSMGALITGMEERGYTRVEGTHSAIKHALESSGSLTKAFNHLDRWLHLHSEESSLQNENESIGIDPLLVQTDKSQLVPLLRKVAQFALNQIKNELLKATTYEACICELRVNYNIPCKHILPMKESIMLATIPTRWLLFPEQDRPNSVSQVQNITDLASSNSMNFLCSTFLDKLDEILAAPVINLFEVKVPEKIVGKGRSSGVKRLPIAVELMEQKEKKKVKPTKKKQIESNNSSQIFIEVLKIPLSTRIPVDDIDQVYDSKSDGNCGFLSLAVAIRGNEENWILVKLAMSEQLNKRME
ncbi:9556_t:CDS:2, partial [Racocetra fulgida]